MTDRLRWRRVLAALLGAVALVAGVVGGVQASSQGSPSAPPPAAGATLPSLPPLDGLPPPDAARGSGAPAFAPSVLVPVPVAAGPVVPAGPRGPASSAEPERPGSGTEAPGPTTRPPHRVGSGYDPADPRYQGADDPGTAAGRAPTSGETQREWVCRQDPAPAGC